MITVGSSAPAFQLLDQDGKKRKLAEFRGKWVVLYFYPRDDTPGCTIEACEFTGGVRGFTKLDAVVLGCSPDSPERHRKFADKYGLKITLLSEPDHEVMEEYGAWGTKVMYGKKVTGVIRSTVIIDPKGNVARRWAKVNAKGHAEAVRAALEELKAGGAETTAEPKSLAKSKKTAGAGKARKPAAAARSGRK